MSQSSQSLDIFLDFVTVIIYDCIMHSKKKIDYIVIFF